MRSTCSLFVDPGKLRVFLKDPLLKKGGELLSLSRNQLRIVMGLLTEHSDLKGHLYKLGAVRKSQV